MVLSEMNIEVFRMINDLGKEYTSLNPFFVLVAEHTVFLLAIAVLMFWFSRNQTNRVMVICGIITFVFAEIMGKIAGKIHSNNQPFAELTNVNQLIEKAVDNSFPSDHTMMFFSFCIIFWLFRKGWSFLWIILACLVGLSRIWVGVHYPADIFVGAVLSIIAALTVYHFIRDNSLLKKYLGIYERIEQSLLPTKSKSKELN